MASPTDPAPEWDVPGGERTASSSFCSPRALVITMLLLSPGDPGTTSASVA